MPSRLSHTGGRLALPGRKGDDGAPGDLSQVVADTLYAGKFAEQGVADLDGRLDAMESTTVPGLDTRLAAVETVLPDKLDEADADIRYTPRTGTILASDYGVVPDGVTDNAPAFAALAAAVNAVPNTDGAVVVVRFAGGPDGLPFRYSGGLDFTRPVRLEGEAGATLHYTGTGYAVKLGPDGLTDSTYHYHKHYQVVGLRFTGGTRFTHGLYFNDHVIEPRVVDCTFENFGHRGGFAVFFQADNWDAHVDRCNWSTDSTNPYGVSARNWIRVRGVATNGVSDNGNSRLRVTSCHARNLNTGGGLGSGIGIWLDGANNQVLDCKIEGFEPNIRLGHRSTRSLVKRNYFETVRVSGADCIIQYGDPADGALPTSYIAGIQVTENYANCHNLDLTVPAYFIAPTTDQTGLRDWTVTDNVIASYAPDREMVRQLNKFSQVENYAARNFGIGVLHTAGANITPWRGEQGEQARFRGLADSATYVQVQGGVTSHQNTGFQLLDHTGAPLASIYFNPFSNRLTIQNLRGGTTRTLDFGTDGHLRLPGGVGFYGTAPVARPTVAGSRADGTALASLLAALVSMGLVTDTTT